MGWYYPHGVNRKALIAQRVEGWERDTGEMLVKSTCLKHCYRGGVFSGVLWSVWEEWHCRLGCLSLRRAGLAGQQFRAGFLARLGE
jgi:hypothetical protein